MVGRGEERVRVGREVDADDLGLLVDDVVDEARVLVGEAVVVLAPDVRAQQVVEGGERPAEVVRALGLAADEEGAILGGNALRLIGRA